MSAQRHRRRIAGAAAIPGTREAHRKRGAPKNGRPAGQYATQTPYGFRLQTWKSCQRVPSN